MKHNLQNTLSPTNRALKFRIPYGGAALITLAAGLCGCTSGPQITREARATQSQIEAYSKVYASTDLLADPAQVVGALDQQKAAQLLANQSSVGRWASKPYVGSKAVAVTGDERLPSIFFAQFDMAFDESNTNGRVSLDNFARRLTAITHVPVRLKRDIWEGVGASSNTAGARASGGGSVAVTGAGPGQSASQDATTTTVDIRALTRSGKVRLIDALNFASDQLGISFSYGEGAVTLERFISEAMELDFGGEGDVTSTLSFGSNATASSTSTASATTTSGGATLSQTQTTKMYASAVAAIREYVSKTPGSSVVATDFGRVMVTTTKETMTRTRELVRQINERLGKRVLVQFDVYHFQNTKADELGFNWSGVFKSLDAVFGAKLTSPGSALGQSNGSLSFNILSGVNNETSQLLGNTSVVVNAFNGVGYTSYAKSYPAILTNRTWSSNSKTETDYFISELVPATATSTTSGGASTAVPGVKMQSLTYGDNVALKARLMDSNKICLTIDASFSDLLALTKADFAGSGYYTQQPKTSQAQIKNEVCQEPGEVLLISGLKRRVASKITNSLGESVPIGAGGSRSVNTTREDLMVVVRATLL